MIRTLAIFALGAAVVVVAIVLFSTRGEDNPYQVRAIFDNAGFVIAGEDVKIAGVKVGKIASLDVTDDFKAVVVLEISEPGYQDFRSDATCIVRPQSLIGERFVECTPTQPRSAGSDPPPPLKEIEDGPGEGQRLLPVENTMQSVDIDLIGNTMREPERERLSLILNELGAGLAGRGRDLNEIIRRANPALRETNKVLAILAKQNTELEQLAVNSDTVLGPLARDRAPGRGGDPQLERRRPRHRRASRRPGGRHRDAARVPGRTEADDGAPRHARRRDDAGARRPRRPGAGDQLDRAQPRPVLAGRDPGRGLARRGVEDRHAGRDRRAARDRRPARPRDAPCGPSA